MHPSGMPTRALASLLSSSHRSALLAGLLALGGGCGGASSRAPGPGMTAIDVTSRVASACELVRLSFLVGGGVKYVSARPEVPSFGVDPRQVARISLPPGTHSLGILASAE